MAFTLPNFNMLCDYYIAGAPPPVGPAVRVGLAFQYYNPSRAQGQGGGVRQFRFPMAANPYGTLFNTGDFLQVTSHWGPNYPGVSFFIADALIMHSGFPNEYWNILASPQLNGGPLPWPAAWIV